MLHPLGSGKAGAPINLGRYGDGAKPIIDGGGAETAAGYQLLAGSPCLEAGAVIPDNISLDFFGNPVPKQIPPAIGAHQRIVNN